jgi:antitoxin component YwqK of YwqJK toxin-antitoxin module
MTASALAIVSTYIDNPADYFNFSVVFHKQLKLERPTYMIEAKKKQFSKKVACWVNMNEWLFCERMQLPNGVLHGEEVVFYRPDNMDDGDVIYSKVSYVNGMKHGPYYQYYRRGALLSKSYYVNGKRQGEAFTYYESGEKKQWFSYKDDMLMGRCTDLRKDGTIAIDSYYVNGLLHGERQFKNKCGKVNVVERYFLGKFLGPRELYDDEEKFVRYM